MADRPNSTSTRIKALQELINVLRDQNNRMRASLIAKDRRIEALELQVKGLLACDSAWDPMHYTITCESCDGFGSTAQNTVTIGR